MRNTLNLFCATLVFFSAVMISGPASAGGYLAARAGQPSDERMVLAQTGNRSSPPPKPGAEGIDSGKEKSGGGTERIDPSFPPLRESILDDVDDGLPRRRVSRTPPPESILDDIDDGVPHKKGAQADNAENSCLDCAGISAEILELDRAITVISRRYQRDLALPFVPLAEVRAQGAWLESKLRERALLQGQRAVCVRKQCGSARVPAGAVSSGGTGNSTLTTTPMPPTDLPPGTPPGTPTPTTPSTSPTEAPTSSVPSTNVGSSPTGFTGYDTSNISGE